MGQALIERDARAADFALAAALDVASAPSIGTRRGRSASAARPASTIGARRRRGARRSDVLVDFTRPDGTLAHAAACAKRGVALVAGTTGLTAAQQDAIARARADDPDRASRRT